MDFVVILGIISVIISLVCAYIGFKIGRNWERDKWNELITLGRIPAPEARR